MMKSQTAQSEIAQLLRLIEIEYLSVQQGLTGFAEVAKHTIITTRMEDMGRLHKHLRALLKKMLQGLWLNSWKPYR